MNNIILLNKKHKQNVIKFLRTFPISNIFLEGNIQKEGWDFNKNKLYAYVKENQIKSILFLHRFKINILSGSKKYCLKLLENIKSFDENYFIIQAYDEIIDSSEIITSETLMFMNKNQRKPVFSKFIKKATIDDIDICLKLKKDFELEYWDYNISDIDENELRKNILNKINQKQVILYSKNNNISGIGFIEVESEKICLIGSIYVIKSQRRKKIGKQITKSLIKYSQNKNKHIILTVRKNNKTAYKTYIKTGFKPLAEILLTKINL